MKQKVRVNPCTQLGPFYAILDVVSSTPEKIIIKRWDNKMQELSFNKEYKYWEVTN